MAGTPYPRIAGGRPMTVDVRRHGAVTVLTINRPERRNALDGESIAALGEAFTAAERDAEIGALVLTGAGDRAFCSGMDLRDFASGAFAVDDRRPGLEVIQHRVYPKPVVAAVNGAAVAGGFELVLACDLVVAAKHATFGMPEVRRGLLAAGGGTRLPRRVPLQLALEMGLTGESIDAHRALAAGLVNRVVPAADVMDEAIRLAGAVARNAPLAVAATKTLMLAEVEGVSRAEIEATARKLLDSEDAREGALAFAERREPRWVGR
ncbi:enoyl-CoA hydratase-related protein [Frankia sp. Cas3]|uniref:enoyl-CoA hydratase-related protein n=1 Tax=Frankia sp. Cas3 TaxID=3073926 RepID=UPI002AD42971|nr:enoyl-CoA hydratase-related protein [Frankia sp. Cas3]